MSSPPAIPDAGESQLRACIVVMGASGSGKTTIAAAVARRLGGAFIDADDLHPPSNIDRMRRGIPLTDDDRRPWLRSVGKELAARSGIVAVACSALARRYREVIRAHSPEAVFVYLHAPRSTLHDRLVNRKEHFMTAAMLDSQLATLEPLGVDEEGLQIDARRAPDHLVSQICVYVGATREITR